ncbi:hypothetical protein [Dyella acidisoli]|uniref:Uncharacterized protein n=1 Tax=Dyella acidisoli TaxID=1867834 RepID=A0ABQ5XR07_9GAMM|nr:hypothetical protein [Dyella acidisoli]GLQ94180.1 hypothetical protein GCM10007901_31310 [Dyella acidisoli]
MIKRRAKPHASPFRQRGVMNLLLVLLIGLAMTVTTMGVVHVMRGSQEGQLSLHSITPAQGSTWMGAETVRRYLAVTNMTSLSTGALKIDGSDALAVNILNITQSTATVSGKSTTVYQVVANITAASATGTPAASKATLQAVYNVTPNGTQGSSTSSSNSGSTVNINTLNFYKDLNLTGGIDVLGGQNANLNVEGNVKLDNASVDGVNSIHATGNVSIGSGIHVNEVYANGDVEVTGAASVDQINALGNVTIDGGAKPFVIQSNGTVTFNGGSASSVTSIGDVIVPAGGVNIGTITTEGNVNWTGTGGGASTIQANGDVAYSGANLSTNITAGGTVTVNGEGVASVTTPSNVIDNANGDSKSSTSGIASLKAGGDLQANGWDAVTGTIGGTLTKQNFWNGKVNVTVQKGYTVSVPTISITKLPPVTIDRPAVDAYALKSSANYVFQMVNGAMQVTVSNINGITSGTYYVGTYPPLNANGVYRGYEDFLCTKLVSGSLDNNGVGQCLEPSTPGRTFCQGQSEENDCLSYSNGAWTISGISFARGILWFQGDLNFNGGGYMDTAIATGNINTGGSARIDAPNYAGYDEMCANATPSWLTLHDATQKQDFDGLYPTNLCDVQNQQLIDSAIGNVALLAGGYVNGVFSGGTINLGAKTVVNGSVMAGSTFNTGGDTSVNGSITAAAQNPNDTSSNQLSGKTTMDFSKLPSTYHPGTVPCMQGCTSSQPSTSGNNTSTINWTRYL